MKRRISVLPTVFLLSMALSCVNPSIVFASGKSLPKVTIAIAHTKTMADRIPITGTFIARQDVHINAQLSGIQILEVHAEIGSEIRKGDVLIELDALTLRGKVAQIDAEILRAEASIRQAQNRIVAAQASLQVAESNLKRNTKLSKSDGIAQSTLDISQGAADEAAANRAIANEDLAIAKAELAQWKAQHEVALLNLSRTRIIAPSNGKITTSTAHVGAIVTPGGEPLMTLMVNSEVELEAEVIETALSRIRVGDHAQFSLVDGNQRQGEVRSISPSVDARTRLGTVKITVLDGTDTWIGSFTQGWLTALEYDALMIPESAVQSTEHGEVVSVVRDGVVEKRVIETGISYEGQREILEGLEMGEQVLARASSFYRDGDRVSVVNPSPDTAESSVASTPLQTKGSVL